jgi:hypothetical protein
MPYKLSWYLPGRIILCEGDGTIESDEVFTFTQRASEMVISGKPLVHVIFDFRQVQKLASVPQALKTLQQNPPHPDMGWVIFVGKLNPMLTTFADFVGMMLRLRYRRLDTIDEAVSFLRERDATLPPR